MTTFYNLVKYNLPEKEKLLEHIIIKPGHPGPVCNSAAGLKWDLQQNSYICFPIYQLAATNTLPHTTEEAQNQVKLWCRSRDIQ